MDEYVVKNERQYSFVFHNKGGIVYVIYFLRTKYITYIIKDTY